MHITSYVRATIRRPGWDERKFWLYVVPYALLGAALVQVLAWIGSPRGVTTAVGIAIVLLAVFALLWTRSRDGLHGVDAWFVEATDGQFDGPSMLFLITAFFLLGGQRIDSSVLLAASFLAARILRDERVRMQKPQDARGTSLSRAASILWQPITVMVLVITIGEIAIVLFHPPSLVAAVLGAIGGALLMRSFRRKRWQ